MELTNEIMAKIAHDATATFLNSTQNKKTVAFWDRASDRSQNDTEDLVTLLLGNPAIAAIDAHEAWRDKKVKAGWVLGPTTNNEKKTLTTLTPWPELSPKSRGKYKVFCSVVRALESVRADLEGGSV